MCVRERAGEREREEVIVTMLWFLASNPLRDMALSGCSAALTSLITHLR